MVRSGIYQIQNLVSGRSYYGSAVDVERRLYDHRKSLNGNYHRNRFLQRAWDKYGEDAFDFSVLELVENKNDLIPREQVYLDEAFSPGKIRPYNICSVAGSLLGTKRTAESRARMSAATKGRIISAEARAKMSAKMKGRIRTKEHQDKLNMARIGFRHTEESKAKVSASKKGTIHSDEWRAKVSAALKGRPVAQSHRDALRDANRSLSAEQVAEIVARRRAGETYVDIAKDYNTTKDTIRNWCLKEGGKPKDRIMPEALRQDIFQSRLAGESLRSICNRLHVGKVTVNKVYEEGLAAMGTTPTAADQDQPALF